MRYPGWKSSIVGLLIATTACGGTAEPDAPEATDAAPVLLTDAAARIGGIDVVPVERVEWRGEWTVPGRLSLDPNATQSLGSIVDGRVTRVYVLPGDAVRAGQALATIHSHEMLDARATNSSALAALLEADSELDLASVVAARTERLYDARAASLSELERARASLVAAEARRTAAQAEAARAGEMMDHLRGSGPVPDGVEPSEVIVRAPIGGVVVDAFVRAGEAITVGEPLITVSDVARLDLTLQIPDAAARSVAPGDRVDFTVAGIPGRSWTATVKRVSPALDTTTRTITVTAAVDGAGELRPEMFATARLTTGGGDRTLVVPAGAIQAMEGDTVVIAAQQNGEGLVLEPVPVRIGRRTPALAEILSGIEADRMVVSSGASIARAEILRRQEEEAP